VEKKCTVEDVDGGGARLAHVHDGLQPLPLVLQFRRHIGPGILVGVPFLFLHAPHGGFEISPQNLDPAHGRVQRGTQLVAAERCGGGAKRRWWVKGVG